MRILLLGVSGLIGHQLLLQLKNDFEVYGTLHRKKDNYGNLQIFSSEKIIENVDVKDFDILKGILKAINPDIILNCVDITKRKITAENTLDVLEVNALFPHKIAKWANTNGKRVIHFSTDCVFDGKIGNYTEESLTTAEDLYGRTKALGEIKYPNTLTIRSSFIGQELFDKTELLDWFLAQDNKTIKGFKKTFYSGVSTIFMTKVVKEIIKNHPDLSGLYQLSPETPISKFDLLNIAKDSFGVNVEIVQDEVHEHTPTLNSSKLRNKTGIKVPSWEDMMSELSSIKDFYKN